MPRTPTLSRDEVLKRMLKTPPTPHAPLKAKPKQTLEAPPKDTKISAGRLPMRSDAVSGKAGRTPETPVKGAKTKPKKPD